MDILWRKRVPMKGEDGGGKVPDIIKEELSAFVGVSVHINGKIQLNGLARIDGKMEGEILSTETVIVGESGELKGQIKVNNLIIKGRVEGEIYSSGKVEIRSKGQVFGSIVAPTLIMEEGAFFEGNCSMQASGSPERSINKTLDS